MLITRISAKNFKTYKSLDLDLTVDPEQPIILIGGLNGGGKTTLFQAIYHSLYGLEISDAAHFKRLVNASVPFNNDIRIELEIDFTGKVLSQDYFYKIKRTYALNAKNIPVESVTLNFNGDDFTYGSAMPIAQRAKAEAEVNKIIKSNLPKELSKYFLFDAMESGNLLKEDYLSRVIKENIENVMGFNKYAQLNDAVTRVKERYIAESIEVGTEREEYKKLVDKKAEHEQSIKDLKEEQQEKLGYSISNKDLYKKAKDGVNLQKEYQEQISFLEGKIKELEGKQGEYLSAVSKFTDDVEMQAFLPKLTDMIHKELEMILIQNEQNKNENNFNPDQLNFINQKLTAFLKDRKFDESQNLSDNFIDFLLADSESRNENEFNFLSQEELNTIRLMMSQTSINNFRFLMTSKESVENELKQLPAFKAQLEENKGHLTKKDHSIIDSFEDNESRLNQIKENIRNLETEIGNLETKINRYDIADVEVPNPKLELAKKIEPMFGEISNALLQSKKKRIEQTMKEDLNSTLVAYAGQIDRVELSDEVPGISFKVFHKAGNEIYLQELNAASKQIIVQVLLKSLHQFGDYNPPVMIDTVFGYLDEASRASLLENYFPKLSHQTILLSSDTEIRKDIDLDKIEGFISKRYTLIRDTVQQLTTVKEGYFNN